MATPSRASQDILLLAKNHYGPWRSTTLSHMLTIIATDALCMTLNSTTFEVEGRWGERVSMPKHNDTRQAIMTVVLRAVREYCGEHYTVSFSIEDIFCKALYEQNTGFYSAVEGLLGLLSRTSIHESPELMRGLPEINPRYTQKFNEMRELADASMKSAHSFDHSYNV